MRLRPFRSDDIPLVQSVAGDPLIPLITTVPTRGSVEDATAWIERQHNRLSTPTGASFCIADSETDEGVGNIGLTLSSIENARADIGYWIAPVHRRRGYVTAALKTITAWADELPLARVQLFVEPWNEGSWRAAEAAGYVREGLLRRWYRIGNRLFDMYCYAHLPHDSAAPLTSVQ